MAKIVVGVDVGGTNIKLGLVEKNGCIIKRSRLSTTAFGSNKTKLIQAIASQILALIKSAGVTRKEVAGVAMGLPGIVDSRQGVVKFLPNVPGWKNVKLSALLQKKLKIPVLIDNDVNLIALGEWKYGAAQGLHNCICITLGTGLGAGLILDDRLYRGACFAAGEIGHTPLMGQSLKQKQFPEVEKFIGHRQLAELAAKIYASKTPMPTQEMFQRANKGEAKALRFWNEAAELIGMGLVPAVTTLNPEAIIIGGGVSNNYKYLYRGIKKTIEKYAMHPQGKIVKIRRAKLGDSAGLMGANVLVHHG